MQIVRFQFKYPLEWRLSRDSPVFFELPHTITWQLLNPLRYFQLEDFKRYDSGNFVEVLPGKIFGGTTEVVFASDDERDIEVLIASSNRSDNPQIVLRSLLVRLRHVTGQATIPSFDDCMGSRYSEVSATLPEYVPAQLPLKFMMGRVQKYLWLTAITEESIGIAASLDSDYVPPVHEVIFLDAIAAFRHGDYRSAILYAAMSAEAAFGSVIAKQYERIVASPKNDRHRVITLASHGGATVKKDPIYERLSRRSDFHVLINELALYVLGRSLLVEDESLYLNAKRLYLTRSKIVHMSRVSGTDSGHAHPHDQNGAIEALTTTVSLFSWLGERADFAMPNIEFISADRL